MTSRRTTKKSIAITALLSGKTNVQAAQDAGVTERTIYRWLSEPDFQSELQEAETQMIESTTRQFAGLQEKAIAVLDQILTAEDVSPHIRLQAANSVFRIAIAFRDRNLELRLSRMEVLVSMFDEYLRIDGGLS